MNLNIKKNFIERQLKHIRLVQDYMFFLEMNRGKLPFSIDEFTLIERSFFHDTTKFSKQFVGRYLTIAEYKENEKNNISNEHIDHNVLFDCTKEYYKAEPHHMEHHYKNGTLPSNLDICENAVILRQIQIEMIEMIMLNGF